MSGYRKGSLADLTWTIMPLQLGPVHSVQRVKGPPIPSANALPDFAIRLPTLLSILLFGLGA